MRLVWVEMTTELADTADPVPTEHRQDGTAADRALLAAERLLTTRLGAQVRLDDPEDLGGSDRSAVVRVRVVRNPFSLPRTLVVKHCTAPVRDGAIDPFAQEAASCQLFTALRPEDRPGPELIACDPAERLLVLEDLGRSGTVAGLLAGDQPARAEQALLDWAHALGRLHANTVGRERDFGALLRRLGAPVAGDPVAEQGAAALAALPEQLTDLLGVVVPDDVADDLARAGELLDGGPYRAFSPADLGPDNAVVADRTVRFIDHEGGGFRTSLLDAAQLRAPLPSGLTGFVLPPGMSEAMVSAWRAEVIGVWPELADHDVLASRLLDGELMWTWLCTWLLLPYRDTIVPDPVTSPAVGDVPDRGGVLVDRWERLAREAELLGRAALTGFAADVAAALRRLYRVAGDPLPPYPVFTRS